MISVVAPVYNEEQVLPEFFSRVTAAARDWGEPYEVILVDDGSTDGSWEAIREFHVRDSRWKAVRLGRNFGHQAAISAGLAFAEGDCVAVMDADLQDPPEEIRLFMEKWKEGNHVVFAVRRRRKESLLKRLSYKAFYRIQAALSYVPVPLDAGDFCLMDRKVVDLLNAMPERHRFVRGLRAWVGFKQTGVPYDRPTRSAGEAKYTFSKLLALAVDGITSFTVVPLRLATIVGLAASSLSFLAAVFYLCTRIFSEFFASLNFPVVPGFATIIIAVFFLGGVQLVFLGIIGEYLGRIYEEVKARPLWTTMEVIGLDPVNDRERSRCREL